MLNEAVDYIIFDPFHPRWREIDAKLIVPELDLLKSGKKTAEEAIRKITPQINKMLQKTDWFEAANFKSKNDGKEKSQDERSIARAEEKIFN